MLRVILSGPLTAVNKEIWQEVGGMIPDSLASRIVILAQHKNRPRKSRDEASRHARNTLSPISQTSAFQVSSFRQCTVFSETTFHSYPGLRKWCGH